MRKWQWLLGGQTKLLCKLNTPQKRVGVLLSVFSVYALLLGVLRVLVRPDVYSGLLSTGIIALFIITILLFCTIIKENTLSKLLQLTVIFFSSVFSSLSEYANQWAVLMLIMGVFLMIAYGWYNKKTILKGFITLVASYFLFALVGVPEGKDGWLISASLTIFVVVFILFMWVIFKNILEVYEKHLHAEEILKYQKELSKRDCMIVEAVELTHELTDYIDRERRAVHGSKPERKTN